MASSSSSDLKIKALREEIDIPQDVYLAPLSSSERGWETHPQVVPRGGLVLGEYHLRILRFPLHPLIHYICVLCNLHLMQITHNGLRCIMGFIAFSMISNYKLTLRDFFFFFSLQKLSSHGGVERYAFAPRKTTILFTGLQSSDKEWSTKGWLMVTGNWNAVNVDRGVFPLRLSMNSGGLLTSDLPFCSYVSLY